MTIRMRILDVLTLGQSGYWGLTDIAEAATLDIIIEDSRVEIGVEREREYFPPSVEEWVASHKAGVDLEEHWRTDLTSLLTAGDRPDVFASYGADAFATLGLLPGAPWVCIGRAVAMLFGQDPATPLRDLLKTLKVPSDSTSELFGAALDARRTALLIQEIVRRVPVDRLLLFGARNCERHVPPLDDNQAWSDVPDRELEWITSSGRYSPDVTWRARQEGSRRKTLH